MLPAKGRVAVCGHKTVVLKRQNIGIIPQDGPPANVKNRNRGEGRKEPADQFSTLNRLRLHSLRSLSRIRYALWQRFGGV